MKIGWNKTKVKLEAEYLAPVIEQRKLLFDGGYDDKGNHIIDTVDMLYWNNTLPEQRNGFVTKEASSIKKYEMELTEDIENGIPSELFHIDGVSMVLCSESIRDAYAMALMMIPLSARGIQYQDEDYADYYDIEDMYSDGISAALISPDSMPFDNKKYYKQLILSHNITNSLIISVNGKNESGDLNELIRTARGLFTNIFIVTRISEEIIHRDVIIMDQDHIREWILSRRDFKRILYSNDLDLMLVPTKRKEDYLEFLRKISNNDEMELSDVEKIWVDLEGELTEEGVTRYVCVNGIYQKNE